MSDIRLFVDRLTVMDFSYLHTERGLLGESWLVDVELAGKLNYQGMVLDFSDVKKQIKQLIDEEFDHKLLVPSLSNDISIHCQNKQCELTFTFANNQILHHQSPAIAVGQIDTKQITEQSVSKALTQRLKQTLPDNISDISIRLYSEPGLSHFYQYSHGLSKHEGNCQRIAHGHRSPIQIFLNNQRNPALEQLWSAKWHDIYIANKIDLKDESNGQYHFSYTSPQGNFSLSLPKSCCYLIDTDSTVENIAQHVADQLRQNYPNDSITVRAFEGVAKGAIA